MKKLPAFILATIVLSSCVNDKQADLILHNGTIYTVDKSFSTADAMVIKNGELLALGTTEDILQQYSAEKTIDLEGKFVYPGLIDAHCHFLGYGKSLLNADLAGTSSFGEIIEILNVRQEKYPSEWILGRGWDQNDWEVKKFPHRKQLDEIFPDNPVLLKRIDGHAAIANTEALKGPV